MHLTVPTDKNNLLIRVLILGVLGAVKLALKLLVIPLLKELSDILLQIL
jgi:hypothetical protein